MNILAKCFLSFFGFFSVATAGAVEVDPPIFQPFPGSPGWFFSGNCIDCAQAAESSAFGIMFYIGSNADFYYSGSNLLPRLGGLATVGPGAGLAESEALNFQVRLEGLGPQLGETDAHVLLVLPFLMLGEVPELGSSYIPLVFESEDSGDTFSICLDEACILDLPSPPNDYGIGTWGVSYTGTGLGPVGAPVPEPSTAWLAAIGAVAIAWRLKGRSQFFRC